MMKSRSVKRPRLISVQTSASGEVAHSSALYFDTLSPEVVSGIVTHLCSEPGIGWHKYELFECGGVFRDALRRSFTHLRMELDSYHMYTVVTEDRVLEKMFVHIWNHFCILDNPNTFESCRYLRSLDLEFDFENDNDIPSLDILFANCGDVLEELRINPRKSSLNLISESIAQHCRSLRSLSLQGANPGFAYIPFFRAVGGKLHRLTLIDMPREPPRKIWQYCSALEELELSSGEDFSFVADIKETLRVITFRSAPPLNELNELVRIVPNLAIHLKNRTWNTYEYLNNVVHAYGEHLRSLWCNVEPELPSDIGYTYSSLVNLETLRLRTERSSMNFLDSFFVAPKPNLRKLEIGGESSMNLFDFLATKVSTLETLLCNVKVPDNPMNDTHLSNFLLTNKRLQCLSIYYGTMVWDERTAKKWEASFERNTVLIIRSLKGYTALRKLKIRIEEWPWIRKQRYEMIADACVGFRRRGLDIEVDGIHYLKN